MNIAFQIRPQLSNLVLLQLCKSDKVKLHEAFGIGFFLGDQGMNESNHSLHDAASCKIIL